VEHDLNKQLIDEGHPWHGAIISPVSRFICSSGLLLYAINGDREDKRQEALAAVEKNLRFIVDDLAIDEQGVVLSSSGQQKPRRPGYELPLGQAVNRFTWHEQAETRDYRPVPLPASTLRLSAQDDSIRLHYQTHDGLDNVAAQLSFDFPAGGLWESESGLFQTAPEQAILYKQGVARMIFGQDVVEFSGGHAEQGYLQMRHSEAIPADCCRIIMSFLTPLDFDLTIRLYRGLSHNSRVFAMGHRAATM
jgi:hypothetical protein